MASKYPAVVRSMDAELSLFGSGRRLPIHPDRGAAIVPIERRVHAQRDRFDPGNPRDRIPNAIEQRCELRPAVAAEPRIYVGDDPPILIESEILRLQPVQCGGEQS